MAASGAVNSRSMFTTGMPARSAFWATGVSAAGGDIAEARAQLLAGVREGIFSRSLPLATRDLRIMPCRLGDRAGVTGAAITAIEHVLSPAAVDRSLQAAVA